MAKQRRRTLALEQLEDRWVPASIRFDGSNLTITNLTGSTPAVNGIGGGPSLAVTQQTNGSFQVKANSKIIQAPPTPPATVGGAFNLDTTTGAGNGNFFVTGNLNIFAGGGNVTIQVTLNNASASSGSLPGNLNITTGNGNDTVILATSTAGGSTGGSIGGNVSVSFGSGADFFQCEPVAGAAVDKLFIGGNVNISGLPGSANLGGVAAKGMENFASHNWAEFNQITPIAAGKAETTTIGGSVNVRGIATTNLGAFTSPTPNLVIGSNVNVQESSSPSPAYSNPDATGGAALYNNYVTLSVDTIIRGGANISGNAGGTFVLADSNVGNSLSLNFAGSNGNNTLDINLNVPALPGGPMVIGKDVNFTAGNGNNTLLFDDSLLAPPTPLDVLGNFNVNFGNGNNSFQFTNLGVPGGDVFINGNFSVRAGNGSNNLATGSAFSTNPGGNVPFLASVLGNESFFLGNGSNTVDLGLPPGGTVFFSGGNGANQFTLENAAVNGPGTMFYNNFTALFGNGANTFTLGTSPANDPGVVQRVTASGQAIGGTGTNIFVQNPDAIPIGVPFVLRNF